MEKLFKFKRTDLFLLIIIPSIVLITLVMVYNLEMAEIKQNNNVEVEYQEKLIDEHILDLEILSSTQDYFIKEFGNDIPESDINEFIKLASGVGFEVDSIQINQKDGSKLLSFYRSRDVESKMKTIPRIQY